MSYRHTLEAALESLHEIEDLVNGFPQNGKIAAVEIDLALQKLRNVYELMLMMRDREEKPAAAVAGGREEKTAAAAAGSREEKTAAAVADGSKEKPTAAATAATLSDQFKGRTTLLESLHQTYDEGDTLAHSRPVVDLMAAIGINDRFTFIRELFNNDKRDFEGTIAILNEAGSFNNAYNYLVKQFNWDMDGEAVQLLLNIIRRKYIKGRNE